MRITNYHSSTDNKNNDIEKYIDSLASRIRPKISEIFPGKDEQKMAEIALIVCSKLLEEHFIERAKFGELPDR